MLAQALPLLTSGAPFVLTFKNGFKRTADWEAALAEQKARLVKLAGDPDVRELHLLANTSNETTLVGRVMTSREQGGGEAKSARTSDGLLEWLLRALGCAN